MIRSIKKGPWLINYEIQSEKVIRLIFSIKAFEPRGWTYEKRINVSKKGLL